jgi:ubiquinone/menaquinone biosynthesis C-methylase UbiE
VKEHNEEHYWSRFAASYDRDGEYVVGRTILEAIKDNLSREERLGQAIEFGCGTGYFTKAVAENATHVLATDLSEEMLEVARRELSELGNITVEKADCRHSSFPAEAFDSAVLVNLLHVIEHPSDCLQETNRILKHRGALIVVDFTGYRMALLKKMALVVRYVRRWGRPPRSGQNALSPEHLVHLVESAGFLVKRVELLEDGTNALYLRGEKR